MRFSIFAMLCFIFLAENALAHQMVSYDHNIYVTRKRVPPPLQAALISQKLKSQYTRDLPEQSSLHAQKYLHHDQKPYTLGYTEYRLKRMENHIHKTARDHS